MCAASKTRAIIHPTSPEVGLLNVTTLDPQGRIFLLRRRKRMARFGIRALRGDLDHVVTRSSIQSRRMSRRRS